MITWRPPLNEGRGKVVVSALMIVFHPGLTRHLVDGWGRGSGANRRASRQPKVEMGRMRKGGQGCHLWKGRETGFPAVGSSAERRTSGYAESKLRLCCRQGEVDVYLM